MLFAVANILTTKQLKHHKKDETQERLSAVAAEGYEGKKMNNTEIARQLGVTEPTVSRMLSGKTRMTVDQLYAFADILGLRARDLLP